MTKATGIDISLNATSVSTSSVIGISANPAMSGTSSVSVIGVYGNPNGMNTKVYGVVGVINNGISGAGVYAGLTAPTSFSGRYAAYMYGNSIVTNGTLTATVVTPSDIRLKQNMQLLPAKTTTAKLLQLQPIEYNLKPIEIPADSVNKQGETIKYTVKQYNEETPFFTQKRYGFVAQEVQKVLPDVVYEGSDGYLGIDYTALVPLLVQTVQEQQKQIEQQQTQIEYLMSVIGNKNQLAEAQKNDTTK
ncbi:hypothetical protein FACS1894156_8140 [Bacteroidia bacterium]|nr:hypothetical protein FACS1894156_8140 [Bacteroidia bacterium]